MTRLTNALLAATCLTLLAAGPAGAFTVLEADDAGNGAFPGEIVPVGATEVIGILEVGDTDHFKWSDLKSGEAFTFSIFGDDSILSLPSRTRPEGTFTAFSAASTTLDQISGEPGPNPLIDPLILSGTVPHDGILILKLEDSGETTAEGYRVTLDAPLAEVSEPAAIALFGFGLAGLAASRRRRAT